MNTTQSTMNSQRSMAAVCRRREQLQAEGVHPEKLAWAVAEASEAAIELATVRGPEMVRTCLERARDSHSSGSESEALLILSAAGVSQLRRELRSVGVSLPLTRNEAFREVRRARRQRNHDVIFDAIRTAGASRILAMMRDRRVPFGEAIASAIVTTSRQATGPDEMKALTTIGGFGVRELHRGLQVDPRTTVRELGAAEVGELLAAESPRHAMREVSRELRGAEAEALALLSFVRPSCVRRAVRTISGRARKRVFDEIRRLRRSGEVTPEIVFAYIRTAGPSHIMEVLSSDQSFERTLADEIIAAQAAGDGDRAVALTGICAFGSWRLRRGVRVNAVDEIRDFGAPEIAEVAAGESPQRELRRLSRGAAGEKADALAAFSLVDPRRLERAAGRALRQRFATAMFAASPATGSGQPPASSRVHGTPLVAVGGKEKESD